MKYRNHLMSEVLMQASLNGDTTSCDEVAAIWGSCAKESHYVMQWLRGEMHLQMPLASHCALQEDSGIFISRLYCLELI